MPQYRLDNMNALDQQQTNQSGVPHRRRPCSECPWRKDTPPGMFTRDRYDELRACSGAPGREVSQTAPLFACHKSPEGSEIACAGWLASVGYDHIGVRIAILEGRLDGSVLSPGPDWPELHETHDEMLRRRPLCAEILSAISSPVMPEQPRRLPAGIDEGLLRSARVSRSTSSGKSDATRFLEHVEVNFVRREHETAAR